MEVLDQEQSDDVALDVQCMAMGLKRVAREQLMAQGQH